MMGIGVVTLKSESIPSSKKMLLELAFNYNSGTPSSKGGKMPRCAISDLIHMLFIFLKTT